MTVSELRRAITEPARRAGLIGPTWWTPSAEAARDAGSLPLVATPWSRPDAARQRLTLDGRPAAAGAISGRGRHLRASLQQRRRGDQRLFLRLVTPGEGTPDTRRALDRAEVEHDEPDVMRRVVEALTEARLLTVDDATVQIAHEALLHSWPRLHAWIEAYRDDLRTRQRISHAAAEWNEERRDPDLLYRGTPLLSALEWATQNPGQLGRAGPRLSRCLGRGQGQAEAVAAREERRARHVRRLAVAALSSSRRAPLPLRWWPSWRFARPWRTNSGPCSDDRGARAIRRRLGCGRQGPGE